MWRVTFLFQLATSCTGPSVGKIRRIEVGPLFDVILLQKLERYAGDQMIALEGVPIELLLKADGPGLHQRFADHAVRKAAGETVRKDLVLTGLIPVIVMKFQVGGEPFRNMQVIGQFAPVVDNFGWSPSFRAEARPMYIPSFLVR